MNIRILNLTFNSINFSISPNTYINANNILLYINNTPLHDFTLTLTPDNNYTLISSLYFDGIVTIYIYINNQISNIAILCPATYLSQGIFTFPFKLFPELAPRAKLSIYKVSFDELSPMPELFINISNDIYGNLSTVSIDKTIFKTTDLLDVSIILNKSSSLKPLDGFYEAHIFLEKL